MWQTPKKSPRPRTPLPQGYPWVDVDEAVKRLGASEPTLCPVEVRGLRPGVRIPEVALCRSRRSRSGIKRGNGSERYDSRSLRSLTRGRSKTHIPGTSPASAADTKTTGRWRYLRTPDGHYQWHGPYGTTYLVTPYGTPRI